MTNYKRNEKWSQTQGIHVIQVTFDTRPTGQLTLCQRPPVSMTTRFGGLLLILSTLTTMQRFQWMSRSLKEDFPSAMCMTWEHDGVVSDVAGVRPASAQHWPSIGRCHHVDWVVSNTSLHPTQEKFLCPSSCQIWNVFIDIFHMIWKTDFLGLLSFHPTVGMSETGFHHIKY